MSAAFDNMFKSIGTHLSDQFGESVSIRPPHGASDGSDDETVAKCIVSDCQVDRRVGDDGEMEVVELRRFQFETTTAIDAVAKVGGWIITSASDVFFIEQINRSAGDWVHANGISVGRIEMTNGIIKG